MDIYDEFEKLIDTLNREEIEYAVCGGIAVALHGHPRFTEDVDILIRIDDLDRVSETVEELGFILHSGRLPFNVGGPNEREIFRISKAAGEDLLTLDLLIVGTAYKNVWKDRERFHWKGRTLNIVSLDGLIEMKQKAGRNKDLLDIEELLKIKQGDRDEK
jgi:hypothetical protein